MIKILFDHQKFSIQTYGGISRYFANIINRIANTPNLTFKLGVLYSKNYYLKALYQPLNNWFFRCILRKERKRTKWNKIYCKYLLKKNDFDVFHPTYFNPYFLKYLKKPLVITIHDMTYEALPEYFTNADPLTWQKRILAEKAAKIIAISETTKKDIIKYLNINEQKIEVIHHGIDLVQPVYASVKNLPAQYILFVGSREAYKNFFILATAFKILSIKYSNLHLVLAGGGDLAFADNEFLIRNGISDKTVQISPTDAQLNTIYKNAECFVFPSLYEGFGLPILEAFNNNCPIILSNCSCFKEIAGLDAALYFDAHCSTDLTQKIESLINNSNLKTQLVTAGKAKLQNYSLKKCVEKTVKIYQSIVEGN